MNLENEDDSINKPITLRIRFLMSLNKLPLINKFVNRALIKSFGFPKSTMINPGFVCRSMNIQVGEHSSLGTLFVLPGAKIKIGSNVSMSYFNKIFSGTHDFSNFHLVIGRPVIIEDYVWVTSNVTILPGTIVGRGAVIGAGSVLAGVKVPPYSIVLGNPAKVVGFRMTPDEIIEFEKTRFPKSERLTKEFLDKNFKKYFIEKIVDIKKYLKI